MYLPCANTAGNQTQMWKTGCNRNESIVNGRSSRLAVFPSRLYLMVDIGLTSRAPRRYTSRRNDTAKFPATSWCAGFSYHVLPFPDLGNLSYASKYISDRGQLAVGFIWEKKCHNITVKLDLSIVLSAVRYICSLLQKIIPSHNIKNIFIFLISFNKSLAFVPFTAMYLFSNVSKVSNSSISI